jgi:hypothetical protein
LANVLAVDFAKLSSNATGDCSVGNAGFWSVPDECELVCAPPVLCATPARGSGVNDGDFEPDGAVDADDELEERLGGPFSPVDADEPGDPDEPESDGCARATPGIVATADPTPSATASAPTRPT